MLRTMDKMDDKGQALLESVGFMIYLAADDDTKEASKQAETEGALTLEGGTGDDDRT